MQESKTLTMSLWAFSFAAVLFLAGCPDSSNNNTQRALNNNKNVTPANATVQLGTRHVNAPKKDNDADDADANGRSGGNAKDKAPYQEPSRPEVPAAGVEFNKSVNSQTVNRVVSAANDRLLSDLTNMAESIPDTAVKTANQAKAMSIKSMNIADIPASGSTAASVTVYVRIQKSATENADYALNGAVDFSGNATKLVQTATANAAAGTTAAVSGKLLCADLTPSQSCQSRVVELNWLDDKGVNPVAQTLTIVRSNQVKLDVPSFKQALAIKWPDPGSNDQTYKNFGSMFNNTQEGLPSSDSIEKLQIDSFETVDGRGEMRIGILSKENEVMLWRLPLVNPANVVTSLAQDGSPNTGADVLLTKDMSAQAAARFANCPDYRTDFEDAIDKMVLVDNDGAGKIRLQITMTAMANDDKAIPINFLLTRRLNPVKQFTDLGL